jgi:hypothetical protein
MAIGFPASYSERISLPSRKCDDVREWLLLLIDKLGWSVVDVSHNSVTATTKPSGASWGERVIFEVASDNAIEAISRCAFPLQLVDWGKNKANIERVRSVVSSLNR